MDNILDGIAALIGRENLFADHASRLAYAFPANYAGVIPAPRLPLAAAAPSNYSRLSKLLAFCSKHGIPLAFRGNGTYPDSCAAPAPPNALVMLSRGMRRIYETDIANCTLRVEPGALCADIAKVAALKGLFFPGIPYFGGPGTIGGLLAANAAGPGYAKYGSPANWLNAMDAWTTDGRRIACLSARGLPMAIAGGLPLAQLFCGTLGALAFIGDCSLRLAPLPAETRLLCHVFTCAEDMAHAARLCLLPQYGIPAALEVFDESCHQCIMRGAADARWLLRAEFHDPDQDMLAKLAKEISIDAHGTVVELPGDFAKRRAELLPALSGINGPFRLERLACMPEDFSGFVENVLAAIKESGLKTAVFAMPGIAAINVAIFKSETQASDALAQKLFGLELMINGNMREESDMNAGRAEVVSRELRPALEIGEALANICDPAGLLRWLRLPERSR